MNKEKLRFAILNELAKGNKDISPESFGVEADILVKEAKFLISEELVRGVDFYFDPLVDFSNAELTLKGEQYLKDNSMGSKVYRTLKELKDWIK